MSKYDNLHYNYIDGDWRDGQSSHEIVSSNPFTGETIATFKAASVDDINNAYAALEKKQQAWGETNPYEVSGIIEKAAQVMIERRDELVDVLVRESGSTVIKANIEVDACIGVIKLAVEYPFLLETVIARSAIPNKSNHIIRKPVGVVTVIGPFNFPMLLAMRSVVTALASGNTVLLKPASTTPISGGILLAKIFEEAGLPAGVLSVVVPKTSEIGDTLYTNPVPSVISFTGSTEVGKRIGEQAGGAIKRCILELGGNNAFVVLEDADVDYAARSAVFGRFLHSGQICMSINRIIVHESIFDEFAEKFVQYTKGLNVGDPAQPDVLVGPLIDEREAKRVEDAVQRALDEGAELLLEGKRDGALVHPYVLKGNNDVYSARTEMFGPVATLIAHKGDDDALRLANDTDAGLSGAVHSKDIKRAQKFAAGWRTGMVHINDQSVNDEPRIAFGGEKASGLGRFGRHISFDEFTTYQWVSIQTEQRQYPI
ncbi:aldehyde dehydrogenase family protein [Psychrobacter aestuarii]|uniref:Benzaldehyde dehydrogenase n=1 Tax=Psychrobacter aestuarii TaxID=556327 RepID=A0ABN0VS19_9GAMM|nr:aldehyde dehydrogenase family protein [Psychrobacter aestuarii]